MSTITKEWLQQAINDYESVRDELPFGLYDYQGNILAALRIALASLEADPVAWRHFQETPADGGYWILNDYKPNCSGVEPLFTAPPAPVSVPEPIKRNDADGWWMYKGRRVGGGCAEWYNRALDDCRAAMLQSFGNSEQLNSPVVPDGLRLALSNAGIAAPESDEMLAATCEKHIQALVTWVKDRKPFKSAVIPDDWVACSERMPGKVLAALQNVARLRCNLNDFCGDKSVIAKCLIEAEEALLNAVNRHSTMLAAAPQQE